MDHNIPSNLLKKSKKIVELRFKTHHLCDVIFDIILNFIAEDSNSKDSEEKTNEDDTLIIQFNNGIKSSYNYSMNFQENLRKLCTMVDMYFLENNINDLESSDTMYTLLLDCINDFDSLHQEVDSIKTLSHNIFNSDYRKNAMKLLSYCEDIKNLLDELENVFSKDLNLDFETGEYV